MTVLAFGYMSIIKYYIIYNSIEYYVPWCYVLTKDSCGPNVRTVTYMYTNIKNPHSVQTLCFVFLVTVLIFFLQLGGYAADSQASVFDAVLMQSG